MALDVGERNDMSDKLTPRSAAQTLQGYQDNHQIELFMQEMLSVVCALLPDDPYEFMTNHVASHRPAPPPPDGQLCGSGALWALLPGGDPQCAEHWRLRRCWLTSKGTLCVSTAPATVQQDGSKLKYRAPDNKAPTTFPVEVGSTYRELDEEEAARPFGFVVNKANKGSSLYLAAGSEEQRDEWFHLLGHFSDPDRRKGPAPTGTVLSPRAEGLGGTQVVDEIGPTDIPMPGPKPAPSTAKPSTPSGTLKPILKSKPFAGGPGAPVPAIRIPRRMPQDPMEAVGDSTRRSSIRFSDDVERREFAVSRAEPVPQSLRAHESRRKPPVIVASAKTASGQPVQVRMSPRTTPASPDAPRAVAQPVRVAATATGGADISDPIDSAAVPGQPPQAPTTEKPPAASQAPGTAAKSTAPTALNPESVQAADNKVIRPGSPFDPPRSPTAISSTHSEAQEGFLGETVVHDILTSVAEEGRPPMASGRPESRSGVSVASARSARSSANGREAVGEIAADMIDSMMLDPIISILEEPLDPLALQFGDFMSETDATSPSSSQMAEVATTLRLDREDDSGGWRAKQLKEIEKLRLEAQREAEETRRMAEDLLQQAREEVQRAEDARVAAEHFAAEAEASAERKAVEAQAALQTAELAANQAEAEAAQKAADAEAARQLAMREVEEKAEASRRVMAAEEAASQARAASKRIVARVNAEAAHRLVLAEEAKAEAEAAQRAAEAQERARLEAELRHTQVEELVSSVAEADEQIKTAEETLKETARLAGEAALEAKTRALAALRAVQSAPDYEVEDMSVAVVEADETIRTAEENMKAAARLAGEAAAAAKAKTRAASEAVRLAAASQEAARARREAQEAATQRAAGAALAQHAAEAQAAQEAVGSAMAQHAVETQVSQFAARREAEAESARRTAELQEAAQSAHKAATQAAAAEVAQARAEAARQATEAEAARAARIAAEEDAAAARAEVARLKAEAEAARREADEAIRVKTAEANARADAERRRAEAEEAMKAAAKQAAESATAAKAQAQAASEVVRSTAGSQASATEVASDADAARRSAEEARKQAAEQQRRMEESAVPNLPQLEQNRSTIVVSAADAAEMGELTSRSMGRLSATRSEVLRDVFDTTALSLVDDIVDESLHVTEEAARAKAAQQAALEAAARAEADAQAARAAAERAAADREAEEAEAAARKAQREAAQRADDEEARARAALLSHQAEVARAEAQAIRRRSEAEELARAEAIRAEAERAAAQAAAEAEAARAAAASAAADQEAQEAEAAARAALEAAERSDDEQARARAGLLAHQAEVARQAARDAVAREEADAVRRRAEAEARARAEATAAAQAAERVRAAQEEMEVAARLAREAAAAAKVKARSVAESYQGSYPGGRNMADAASPASRRSTIAHEVATDLLDRLLRHDANGMPAGTEPADMIDVSAVGDEEQHDTLKLRFNDLDYDEVDHNNFIQELLFGFKALGLSEKNSSQLHISVSKGSILAEVSAPRGAMRALKSLPLSTLTVLGCPAELDKLMLFGKPIVRPLSGLSRVSAVSSAAEQEQANRLMSEWIVPHPRSPVGTIFSDRSGAQENLFASKLFGTMVQESKKEEPQVQPGLQVPRDGPPTPGSGVSRVTWVSEGFGTDVADALVQQVVAHEQEVAQALKPPVAAVEKTKDQPAASPEVAPAGPKTDVVVEKPKDQPAASPEVAPAAPKTDAVVEKPKDQPAASPDMAPAAPQTDAQTSLAPPTVSSAAAGVAASGELLEPSPRPQPTRVDVEEPRTPLSIGAFSDSTLAADSGVIAEVAQGVVKICADAAKAADVDGEVSESVGDAESNALAAFACAADVAVAVVQDALSAAPAEPTSQPTGELSLQGLQAIAEAAADVEDEPQTPVSVGGISHLTLAADACAADMAGVAVQHAIEHEQALAELPRTPAEPVLQQETEVSPEVAQDALRVATEVAASTVAEAHTPVSVDGGSNSVIANSCAADIAGVVVQDALTTEPPAPAVATEPPAPAVATEAARSEISVGRVSRSTAAADACVTDTVQAVIQNAVADEEAVEAAADVQAGLTAEPVAVAQAPAPAPDTSSHVAGVAEPAGPSPHPSPPSPAEAGAGEQAGSPAQRVAEVPAGSPTTSSAAAGEAEPAVPSEQPGQPDPAEVVESPVQPVAEGPAASPAVSSEFAGVSEPAVPSPQPSQPIPAEVEEPRTPGSIGVYSDESNAIAAFSCAADVAVAVVQDALSAPAAEPTVAPEDALAAPAAKPTVVAEALPATSVEDAPSAPAAESAASREAVPATPVEEACATVPAPKPSVDLSLQVTDVACADPEDERRTPVSVGSISHVGLAADACAADMAGIVVQQAMAHEQALEELPPTPGEPGRQAEPVRPEEPEEVLQPEPEVPAEVAFDALRVATDAAASTVAEVHTPVSVDGGSNSAIANSCAADIAGAVVQDVLMKERAATAAAMEPVPPRTVEPGPPAQVVLRGGTEVQDAIVGSEVSVGRVSRSTVAADACATDMLQSVIQNVVTDDVPAPAEPAGTASVGRAESVHPPEAQPVVTQAATEAQPVVTPAAPEASVSSQATREQQQAHVTETPAAIPDAPPPRNVAESHVSAGQASQSTLAAQACAEGLANTAVRDALAHERAAQTSDATAGAAAATAQKVPDSSHIARGMVEACAEAAVDAAADSSTPVSVGGGSTSLVAHHWAGDIAGAVIHDALPSERASEYIAEPSATSAAPTGPAAVTAMVPPQPVDDGPRTQVSVGISSHVTVATDPVAVDVVQGSIITCADAAATAAEADITLTDAGSANSHVANSYAARVGDTALQGAMMRERAMSGDHTQVSVGGFSQSTQFVHTYAADMTDTAVKNAIAEQAAVQGGVPPTQPSQDEDVPQVALPPARRPSAERRPSAAQASEATAPAPAAHDQQTPAAETPAVLPDAPPPRSVAGSQASAGQASQSTLAAQACAEGLANTAVKDALAYERAAQTSDAGPGAAAQQEPDTSHIARGVVEACAEAAVDAVADSSTPVSVGGGSSSLVANHWAGGIAGGVIHDALPSEGASEYIVEPSATSAPPTGPAGVEAIVQPQPADDEPRTQVSVGISSHVTVATDPVAVDLAQGSINSCAAAAAAAAEADITLTDSGSANSHVANSYAARVGDTALQGAMMRERAMSGEHTNVSVGGFSQSTQFAHTYAAGMADAAVKNALAEQAAGGARIPPTPSSQDEVPQVTVPSAKRPPVLPTAKRPSAAQGSVSAAEAVSVGGESTAVIDNNATRIAGAVLQDALSSEQAAGAEDVVGPSAPAQASPSIAPTATVEASPSQLQSSAQQEPDASHIARGVAEACAEAAVGAVAESSTPVSVGGGSSSFVAGYCAGDIASAVIQDALPSDGVSEYVVTQSGPSVVPPAVTTQAQPAAVDDGQRTQVSVAISSQVSMATDPAAGDVAQGSVSACADAAAEAAAEADIPLSDAGSPGSAVANSYAANVRDSAMQGAMSRTRAMSGDHSQISVGGFSPSAQTVHTYAAGLADAVVQNAMAHDPAAAPGKPQSEAPARSETAISVGGGSSTIVANYNATTVAGAVMKDALDTEQAAGAEAVAEPNARLPSSVAPSAPSNAAAPSAEQLQPSNVTVPASEQTPAAPARHVAASETAVSVGGGSSTAIANYNAASVAGAVMKDAWSREQAAIAETVAEPADPLPSAVSIEPAASGADAEPHTQFSVEISSHATLATDGFAAEVAQGSVDSCANAAAEAALEADVAVSDAGSMNSNVANSCAARVRDAAVQGAMARARALSDELQTQVSTGGYSQSTQIARADAIDAANSAVQNAIAHEQAAQSTAVAQDVPSTEQAPPAQLPSAPSSVSAAPQPQVDDVPTDAAGVADSIVQNAIAEEHAPQSPTAVIEQTAQQTPSTEEAAPAVSEVAPTASEVIQDESVAVAVAAPVPSDPSVAHPSTLPAESASEELQPTMPTSADAERQSQVSAAISSHATEAALAGEVAQGTLDSSATAAGAATEADMAASDAASVAHSAAARLRDEAAQAAMSRERAFSDEQTQVSAGGHSQATQMARADAADVADRVLQNAIASEETAQTATASSRDDAPVAEQPASWAGVADFVVQNALAEEPAGQDLSVLPEVPVQQTPSTQGPAASDAAPAGSEGPAVSDAAPAGSEVILDESLAVSPAAPSATSAASADAQEEPVVSWEPADDEAASASRQQETTQGSSDGFKRPPQVPPLWEATQLVMPASGVHPPSGVSDASDGIGVSPQRFSDRSRGSGYTDESGYADEAGVAEGLANFEDAGETMRVAFQAYFPHDQSTQKISAWADPAKQSEYSDYGGSSRSSRGSSQRLSGQPSQLSPSHPSLVDPNIISQLCQLLNAPDTPPSDRGLRRPPQVPKLWGEETLPAVPKASPAPAVAPKAVPKAVAVEPVAPLADDRATQKFTGPQPSVAPLADDRPTQKFTGPQPSVAPLADDRPTQKFTGPPPPEPINPESSRSSASQPSPSHPPLVDPHLIAELCRLLNAPETPPSERERLARRPLPRRRGEEKPASARLPEVSKQPSKPGLAAEDAPGPKAVKAPSEAFSGGPSQPNTARTSVRSHCTSDAEGAEGKGDLHEEREALEEEVCSIMDVLRQLYPAA